MMPYEDPGQDPGRAEGYPAAAPLSDVPVRHRGVIKTTETPARTGSMFTITVPASAAGSPSVARIAGQDYSRRAVYLQALDSAVVICTSEAAAQDPNNLTGSFGGASASAAIWSPPITHCEEIWVANTSTSSASRVSVIIETGAVDPGTGRAP